MLVVRGEEIEVMVTATTPSATASSSREGSKKMFSPTAITRSVIGGLELLPIFSVVLVEGLLEEVV